MSITTDRPSDEQLMPNDGYQEEYSKDFVSYWDHLIDWDGRAKGEEGFFGRILAAHNVKSVADVACGTGFHSVMLAREGFEVTATDGSENMVRRTQHNAERYGAKLKDVQTVDWLNLPNVFGHDRFDALVCLGNAFTHLFEHEARRDVLRAMYDVVKPGGLVIIDHRNYDSMLDNGFSTKHQYYYTGHGVNAEPIVINRTLTHFEYTFPDGAKFHLKLYPLKQGYMRFLLQDSGFVEIMPYGDFERPFEDDVDFIQQIAFKPRGRKRTN